MTAPQPDRYDPTGEAALWDRASDLVMSLQHPDQSSDWNAALEQAARMLSNESRGVRQAGGMYHRVITGSNYQPKTD